MEFKPFPKLARLNRDIVVTEKIDGTNAQIVIQETFDPEERDAWLADPLTIAGTEGPASAMRILAGSRTRWITPGKEDNFGFAGWVKDNASELFDLSVGQHFGEWWGKGIQRGYGLQDRRFSLFNTNRWYDTLNHVQLAPEVCSVVPILYMGPFSEEGIKYAIDTLKAVGSYAAPEYMDPEGVVVYHTAANAGFKVTIKNDEKPKGQVN